MVVHGGEVVELSMGGDSDGSWLEAVMLSMGAALVVVTVLDILWNEQARSCTEEVLGFSI